MNDTFKGLNAIRKGDMMAGNGQNDLTNNECRVRYVEHVKHLIRWMYSCYNSWLRKNLLESWNLEQ